MARTMVLMLLLIGMIVVAALHLAPAEHACVSFSVTNPYYPLGDEECSPTDLPFDGSAISPGACATVSPAEVIMCATLSLHLP